MTFFLSFDFSILPPFFFFAADADAIFAISIALFSSLFFALLLPFFFLRFSPAFSLRQISSAEIFFCWRHAMLMLMLAPFLRFFAEL